MFVGNPLDGVDEDQQQENPDRVYFGGEHIGIRDALGEFPRRLAYGKSKHTG